MILPTFHSSMRARNVTIGHVLTFSTNNPITLDSDGDSDQSETMSGTESELDHNLNRPHVNCSEERRSRVRVLSESEASSAGRAVDSEFQESRSSEGVPFRARSQSAPAALWAAKRYGRQLRRMSDEFDTWLDKGEMKKVRSVGVARQMKTSRSWFSFLWSPRETEDEPGEGGAA
ncbi:bcl2-associated agonist of cell death-like [Megalops cyprinoides]|uniref:bcl2-associated agonist of cell death-like n=1 Tax=Megalops cyprinoides TaxID=118141 RepID=UPI0018655B12|nr:bcl2-associated agonist of cell death-like [Megalops cyprinoides]